MSSRSITVCQKVDKPWNRRHLVDHLLKAEQEPSINYWLLYTVRFLHPQLHHSSEPIPGLEHALYQWYLLGGSNLSLSGSLYLAIVIVVNYPEKHHVWFDIVELYPVEIGHNLLIIEFEQIRRVPAKRLAHPHLFWPWLVKAKYTLVLKDIKKRCQDIVHVACLAESHVQEGLLDHHTQVFAKVVLSFVIDDLHVHVSLLLRIEIQLDVDVNCYAEPDVHDQVNTSLNEISSQFLQLCDLDSRKLQLLEAWKHLNHLLCCCTNFITADHFMNFGTYFWEYRGHLRTREALLYDGHLDSFEWLLAPISICIHYLFEGIQDNQAPLLSLKLALLDPIQDLLCVLFAERWISCFIWDVA